MYHIYIYTSGVSVNRMNTIHYISNIYTHVLNININTSSVCVNSIQYNTIQYISNIYADVLDINIHTSGVCANTIQYNTMYYIVLTIHISTYAQIQYNINIDIQYINMWCTVHKCVVCNT